MLGRNRSILVGSIWSLILSFNYCLLQFLEKTLAIASYKLVFFLHSGGLTNYLYLCSLPDDIKLKENEPRKVLIRIHGDIVDKKQRFYEAIIFTLLSERGIGPKTYGIFYSGRIEEFIPVSWVFFTECIVVINGLVKVRKPSDCVSLSIISSVFQIHCRKKRSFPLRISSVDVTKFAVFCGFGHIYWRNP